MVHSSILLDQLIPCDVPYGKTGGCGNVINLIPPSLQIWPMGLRYYTIVSAGVSDILLL